MSSAPTPPRPPTATSAQVIARAAPADGERDRGAARRDDQRKREPRRRSAERGHARPAVEHGSGDRPAGLLAGAPVLHGGGRMRAAPRPASRTRPEGSPEHTVWPPRNTRRSPRFSTQTVALAAPGPVSSTSSGPSRYPPGTGTRWPTHGHEQAGARPPFGARLQLHPRRVGRHALTGLTEPVARRDLDRIADQPDVVRAGQPRLALAQHRDEAAQHEQAGDDRQQPRPARRSRGAWRAGSAPAVAPGRQPSRPPAEPQDAEQE